MNGKRVCFSDPPEEPVTTGTPSRVPARWPEPVGKTVGEVWGRRRADELPGKSRQSGGD